MTPATFRRIRKDRFDLSTEAMARVMGVSGRTIRYWEKGDKPITGPAALAARYMEQFGLPDKALPPLDPDE